MLKLDVNVQKERFISFMKKAKVKDEIFFPWNSSRGQVKHIVNFVGEDDSGVYYLVNSLYSIYKDGEDNNWIQSLYWDLKEKWYHEQYEKWHEGESKVITAKK